MNSQQRPPSPLLSKALNETFDEVYGNASISTPKSKWTTTNTFGFLQRKSNNRTSIVHKFMMYLLPLESFERLVKWMKYITNLSIKSMKDSLNTIHKSNQRLISLELSILILVFPILIDFLVQLSQYNNISFILDVLLLSSILLLVLWKLLSWSDWKYANMIMLFGKTQVDWAQFRYTIHRHEWQVAMIHFRQTTLGWYTSNEILSLQKDLQHLELHLQETKRQLVRCQLQHQAEKLELTEIHQQQVQAAMEQAEHDQSKTIQTMLEQHEREIQDIQQQHERAMQTELCTITDLRQTLQKQQLDLTEFHQRQMQSTMEQIKNDHSQAMQDLMGQHEQVIDTMKQQHEQAIDTMKQQHEQAIDTMKQQHEQAIKMEHATVTDLRQMLERQEILLQEERRKVTSIRQSMDRLEQIARKDANQVKELTKQLSNEQRVHETEKQDMQSSYQQAWISSKKNRQAMEATFHEESTRVQHQLIHHQLRNQKLNRLVCQLLIVADEDNHYFFEDCDDVVSIQDKGKVLQEAIHEASMYVADLKRRTRRDESLCIPPFDNHMKDLISSESSVVSELTMQEREAILEALSKDMDEQLDRSSINTSALWKRSCMLLLATAGVTTVAATSPRALITLFASRK
jgi:myosin heavy subunit